MPVTVLTYHHVDAGIARHIRFLRAFSQLMTARGAVEALNSQSKAASRITVLTFDDGYEEVHRWLLPAVREMKVAASVYVPGRILNDPEPFWWDRIEMMVAQADAPELAWRGSRYDLSDPTVRSSVAQRINSTLTQQPGSKIATALCELERALRPKPAEVPARYRVMDKSQLLELSAAGVEIGSHTMSHQCLTSLSESEASEELRDSKALLAGELGVEVRGLAYPFGGSEFFNDTICRLAEDAGYDYGLTTVAGRNRPGTQRFRQRRFFVSTADSVMVLMAMICGVWSTWARVHRAGSALYRRVKKRSRVG